jgi:hypothetical protein
MNDIKNFLLAYFSTVSSVFAAIETRTLITIISAIVLPIVFFAIGKTVDVLLQIHLNKKRNNEQKHLTEYENLSNAAEADRADQRG